MRNYYPKILIDGELNDSYYEFVLSINFSSHCDYFISDQSTLHEKFVHIHEVGQNSFNHIFDKKIQILDNKFSLSSVPPLSDISARSSVAENSILKRIELINNPSGNIEIIGAVARDNNILIGEECRLIDRNHLIKYLPQHGDWITCSVSIQDNEITYKLNEIDTCWRRFRLRGVNIPLMIIQIILGRDVKSIRHVTECIIDNRDNIETISLKNFNYIWFDLDETLICRGKPIKLVVDFLKRLQKINFPFGLLTRHERDIVQTLASIGLDPVIFSNIIKVEKHELKSFFVNSGNLLIDNEFPQRYDVLMNNGISIDLDQIEFIRND